MIRRPPRSTLFSLHDALPISREIPTPVTAMARTLPIRLKGRFANTSQLRSEEHTSELQSRGHLVCRLLLEKKNSAESHNDATRLPDDHTDRICKIIIYHADC